MKTNLFALIALSLSACAEGPIINTMDGGNVQQQPTCPDGASEDTQKAKYLLRGPDANYIYTVWYQPASCNVIACNRVVLSTTDATTGWHMTCALNVAAGLTHGIVCDLDAPLFAPMK